MQNIFSQTNKITIDANLNTTTHEIQIKQKTVFYNKSEQTLKEVYFHNWANAYKNKNTPLAKRFIEKNSKSFHFAKEKHRGHSKIETISINGETSKWEISDQNPDILKIELEEELKPKDSIVISKIYTVKLPRDKFTRYGIGSMAYNLRYWYLSPAIFKDEWKLFNNLDLDDLYADYTDFFISFTIPDGFNLISDLSLVNEEKNQNQTNTYNLKGTNFKDVFININEFNEFTNYTFDDIQLITNMNNEKLNLPLKSSILKREFYFLKLHLGEVPNKNILLNKIEYDKNPVYGFSQLPSFLAPFSHTFEFDIQTFKLLSKKYIEQLFIINKREDAWLADGLQNYLMIKYVERYYPEIKAIGEISKLWGVRKFNLAQINFNDKYPYVYQFAARKNLDQPLTMRADSLSNFNYKITNKFKAGLGLQYLEAFLDDLNFKSIILNFSRKNNKQHLISNDFLNDLKSNTAKDISWFENDYLNTNKKIDYTIKKIERKEDSIRVTIQNKRNISVPIQLYGVYKNEIKFKKWLPSIDSTATISIPKNGYDRLSLNYELLLPEYNLRNNWKNVKKRIFNRPLKPKFLLDIENPYYNQFFYTPVVRYNYYDGLVMGLTFSNKTILKKRFVYKLTPSIGSKSKQFSGSYSFAYEYLPENKKINRFFTGFAGSSYQYAEGLRYTSFFPFATLEFKRKSLRDISSKSISASYIVIDKEKSPTQIEHPESNKYKVFNIGYGYAKPAIIEDIRFSTGLQVSEKFSKLSLTARYRKLTNANTQLDFRFFAGTFLSNNTESDYFSYALDRPSDYLFKYDYLGRSEKSGIFSQQIIINEGGFKSKLEVPFANQWLTTFNTSVGLWRWLEVYNDIGLVKNRGQKVYFAHENGIRLNFIQDILEVYFPIHSNLGWEIDDAHYSSKIRFVLVIKPKRIFNFVRRGFY